MSSILGIETSGIDPRVDQAIRILEPAGQRQDDVTNQMTDVLALATAAGCNDEVDLIKRALG